MKGGTEVPYYYCIYHCFQICWYFLYLGALMLGGYIFVIVMYSLSLTMTFLVSCYHFDLNLFSLVQVQLPPLFCFPFAGNIFFPSLTFSLRVTLKRKWVPCRQHRVGSFFSSLSPATLCLLKNLIHLHLKQSLIGKNLLLSSC